MDHSKIPKIFQSDLTDQPFTNCIQCDINVLETGGTYLIEKAIKSYPNSTAIATIFEYAICMKCYQQTYDELSSDSKTNMQAFVTKNLQQEKRLKLAENQTSPNDSKWIDHCAIKGTSRSMSNEYQICAHCTGNELIESNPPIMISGEALEDMIELLSAETLDTLDRFKESIVGGPPEFEELFSKRKLLLI